ncbi:MAG: HAMP domain-containing protein, partial [Bdellovibrionales bacterium]|nr:HAMP domain-containing protein [Bdellovibrionales bacterium]
LISVLFSRGLTKNLHRLTESAQRIGKGDLSTKIEVHSRDEVQTLALTFNQMIDALKESREAIERHNRELEQKVAERTQELREKNLAIEEIQDKLVKSAQLAAAGEVAGRTAHEVLNPLTAIVGRMERVDQYVNNQEASPAEQFLDILTAWETDYQKGGMKKLVEALATPSKVLKNASLFEEDLTNLKQLALYWMQQQEQLGGDIHFVKDQAGRIQRIVDGMRELVRSSTMKDEVPCHAAIGEAVLTLQDIVEKAGVKLQTQLEAERDGAHLNRDELIQILTNLIRNAFQALKQNNIQNAFIRVETHNEDNQLFIDIIDNGKGIAPAQKEKIFEQGFTTKPPAEGTGLGLSIARRYARAFGGDVILAYSAPNDGTCFRVIVPLLDTPALSKAS